MNFFERQANMRKETYYIASLFVLVMVVTAAIFGFSIAFIYQLLIAEKSSHDLISALLTRGFFHRFLMTTSVITLIMLLLSWWYASIIRSQGGIGVARGLSAKEITKKNNDFYSKRVSNVVEEMAIASGIPVPRIYVLYKENGINALAAGYTAADAVIIITKGTWMSLNRDELQSVIGHEFSHILNGDMTINMRMLSWIFPLVLLFEIGYRFHSISNDEINKGSIWDTFAGFFMGFGYIGVLISSFVKSMMSHNREYFADASSVRFTRQRDGLVGALKKIAALEEGSAVRSVSTQQISHMMFCSTSTNLLFDTHPSVIERIKAIDPTFKPSEIGRLKSKWRMQQPNGQIEDQAKMGNQEVFIAAATTVATAAPQFSGSPDILTIISTLEDSQISYSSELMKAIPEKILAAAHSENDCIPLILSLTMIPGGTLKGLKNIGTHYGESVYEKVMSYNRSLCIMPRHLLFPLLQITLPALTRLPDSETKKLMLVVDSCIHNMDKVPMYEYCLTRLLKAYLRDTNNPGAALQNGYKRIDSILPKASKFLAIVAQTGQPLGNGEQAYLSGMKLLQPNGCTFDFNPPEHYQEVLDELWPILDSLHPADKRILLDGMLQVINHDGIWTMNEKELCRVICASLHCPLPVMPD